MTGEMDGYMGIAIALTTNQYYYWMYSDVVGGAQPEYPIIGKYTLDDKALRIESSQQLYSSNWHVINTNGLQCLVAEFDSPNLRLLKPHPNFNPKDPFGWKQLLKTEQKH